jgi:hypothetical protein
MRFRESRDGVPRRNREEAAGVRLRHKLGLCKATEHSIMSELIGNNLLHVHVVVNARFESNSCRERWY